LVKTVKIRREEWKREEWKRGKWRKGKKERQIFSCLNSLLNKNKKIL
jgi:hypothetical protein